MEETLGKRIVALRKRMKLTQDQLADRLGVTAQAVSKWETDQSAPDSIKMIHLAEVLDTDIEYLTTGRRNFGRRPPVVLTEVKVVEKVVEKPVVQVKTVEKVIKVPEIQYVDKEVVKKVYRTKYRRNPAELLLVGLGCFLIGFLIGHFL